MNHTSIDFKSFTQILLKALQSSLGSDFTVYSQIVSKNNGSKVTGIVARQSGYRMSPTIYIDRFYKEGMGVEEVQRIAEELYQEFRTAEYETDLNLAEFAEYSSAKEKLAFKLINAEKNKEILKQLPHRLFHDLAIVFYYSVQDAPFYGNAVILINHSHREKWGVTVEDLFQTSLRNTPKLFPGEICKMEDVMQEVILEEIGANIASGNFEEEKQEDLAEAGWIKDIAEQVLNQEDNKRAPMYVLTNRQRMYGAACILYPEILKHFAEERKQDFYLLPCSVHEMILMPAGTGVEPAALREIVADINRTQVETEDILSDSVYFYSRSRDTIVWIS